MLDIQKDVSDNITKVLEVKSESVKSPFDLARSKDIRLLRNFKRELDECNEGELCGTTTEWNISVKNVGCGKLYLWWPWSWALEVWRRWKFKIHLYSDVISTSKSRRENERISKWGCNKNNQHTYIHTYIHLYMRVCVCVCVCVWACVCAWGGWGK